MARIRGMAFLGAIRHIKRSHGSEMLTRVIRDAGPDAQEAFSRPISGLALHPYAAFVGLLLSVDRNLGKGDLKVYAVRPSAENMIRACTPIWGMYIDDAGVMEAVDVRPENTVLRIEGFPDMHPAHCRLMEGWMIAAMDVVGVSVLPGARERECTSTGGNWHEFWCQWVPKS